MITTPSNRLAAATVLTAVACGMTACAGSSASSPTTTGAGGASAHPASAAHPVVLRVGTDDGPDAPGAQQIQHFAADVSRLSQGALEIKPVWHADGEGTPHWDQAVAHLVMQGGLDLAMVPSRSWDDLGVDSLRALTAPFLVTTDTLTARIVSDDSLTAQLTSGLPKVGVTALGLYPEGLRHPFGFDHPLRGVADYRNGVVRAAWSRTANATFEALGATTSDDLPDTETMVGAESSYRLSPAGTATGNVVFYPKVNVLVLGDQARGELTTDQVSLLDEAASDTGNWVLRTLPTDAQAAATFCAEAGRIAAATPEQVQSLIDATRGVVTDLRSDPTTANLIDEIGTLAQDDPQPRLTTSCRKQGSPHPAAVDGTYVVTVTADQERKAGASDQGLIDENAGRFTLTLADGRWTQTQVYTSGPKTGSTFHGSGGYTVAGNRLQWFWGHEPGAWTKVVVDVHQDGSLHFSHVDDGGDQQSQSLSDAFFTAWAPRA